MNDTAVSEPVLSWGDQGDGTYRNPILHGDYSDPDVIRIDSDYYLVTSTFHLSPSVSVLHSRDLVNWTFIGHVFDDLSRFHPNYGPDRMKNYGDGAWAPAIRHHDGKFWVYLFDYEFGLYMATAKHPAGPWTPAHQVLAKQKSTDPCPFWDDEGKMYITYANAHNHEPGGYDMILRGLSPDGKTFTDSGTIIHQGDVTEATKVLKINEFYYIFYCEHFPGIHRAQMAMRSKNVHGPYEHRMLCKPRGDNGINASQGGLVDDGKGNWWFIHHHGKNWWSEPHFDTKTNPLGRTLGLQPVTWVDDWPIIGTVEADGIGRALTGYQKPVQGGAVVRPQSSDEFDEATLSLQWHWNHAPRNEKWSLTERKGFLRLHASKTLGGGFKGACNSLLQRAMGDESDTVTTCLEVGGMADGEVGGLCVISKLQGLLKIVQENGHRFFQVQTGEEETRGAEITTDRVWLRAVSKRYRWQFSVSSDGVSYVDLGPAFTASGWAAWRGVQVGLFNWNECADAGFLDVDWFHYEYK